METNGKFYIGTSTEDKSPILYDPDDLTTHAVVVGMTGSGKTGLCIDILEEAALQNIPALMIDPKGDITNTLLHFPELLPSDFEPWINPDEARKNKISNEEAAEKTAKKWQKGLKGSGIGKDRLQKLKDSAQFTVYTPGSKAGVQVNILASLAAPLLDWDTNEELLREKISSTVTALLGLVGFTDIDPVQSREHILLANIFESSWRDNKDLSLADLITLIQKPPFDKLGVFDLDTFFPEKDRFGIAMRINNILASPSFQSWVEGQPLDIQSLLYTDEGKIRHSVFYIAHLSDAERMFFVTLLYAAYETWMRTQSGTTSLRAILYFDEIMGYIPPTANPSSKPIMLRMLKQGRAFGVSQILVTQNPVDLDYKAMSNAGTWMIGKLQTENDKKRLLEGLEGVTSASINRRKYDKLITGLKKRQFLLHNIHEKKPVTFSTRWAMNYLAGPLTRTKIPALNHLAGVTKSSGKTRDRAVIKKPKLSVQSVNSEVNATSSPLTSGITEFYLPNNLTLSEAYQEFGRDVPKGATKTGVVYKPSLIAQAEVRFLNRTYKLDKMDKIACLVENESLKGIIQWEEFQSMAFSSAQLNSKVLSEAEYSPISRELKNNKKVKAFSGDFIDWIYADHRTELFFNKTLKKYSEPGDTEGQFRKTISTASEKESEREIKKLEARYKKKINTLKKKVVKEQRELDEDEKDLSQRKLMEVATHFENIFGGGGGRRRISSSLSKRRQTAKAKLDVEESLEVIDELQHEIEDLLVEMEDAIDEIEEKWAEIANQVEEISIAPYKKDIFLSFFGVAWVPYLQVETKQAGTVEILAFKN